MKFTLYIIFLSFFIFTFLDSNLAQNNPLANQIRLAKSFEARGDFEEAEKIYAKIYAEQPKNYQFYNFYYNVLVNQKKYEEELFTFTISHYYYWIYIQLQFSKKRRTGEFKYIMV